MRSESSRKNTQEGNERVPIASMKYTRRTLGGALEEPWSKPVKLYPMPSSTISFTNKSTSQSQHRLVDESSRVAATGRTSVSCFHIWTSNSLRGIIGLIMNLLMTTTASSAASQRTSTDVPTTNTLLDTPWISERVQHI